MFPEGWSHKKLGEVATVIDCKHRTPTYVPQGIPLVSPGTIKWGPLDLKTPVKHVSNEEYESLMDHCEVTVGDLVLSRNQSVGIASFVCNDSPFVLGQDTVLVKPLSTISSYLFYNLQSETTQRLIFKLAGGSTFSRINLSEIRKLRGLYPPLPEQRKIAQILQTWDRAIATTEKLIDASKQQKKALMQQLLTGKKRFAGFEGEGFKKTIHGPIPNDWRYLAISAIADHYSEKNILDKKYPVVSCSKHVGFVDSLQYFKKKVYSEDLSGYKLIPRGCFGFPSNHIEEGSIGRQNQHEIGLVSPIYTVFKPKKEMVDSKFLISVLKTDQYRQIFSAATNASVDRRGSLRWKEFGLIKIALPSLDEQKKISSALSTADAKMSTLGSKLAHLKAEKKALMQQLLTGKRRVKVDD